MASTPSSRGMVRSMRITSGRSRAASATASSPSPASPTTSSPSWSPRNVRSPSRTTAWSSTTSTVIGGSAMPDGQRHRGPRPRGRGDLEPAAEPAGPLLHRGQPEVAGSELGIRGIEPGPVVADDEHEAARAPAEPDPDPPGAGVAQGILERLLGDAEDLEVAAP